MSKESGGPVGTGVQGSGAGSIGFMTRGAGVLCTRVV